MNENSQEIKGGANDGRARARELYAIDLWTKRGLDEGTRALIRAEVANCERAIRTKLEQALSDGSVIIGPAEDQGPPSANPLIPVRGRPVDPRGA